MREHCVPGSLSSSPAQEPGNEASSPHTVNVNTLATSPKHLLLAVFTHIARAGSGPQSKNVMYCLHVTHSCVKLQSINRQINTYDR